MVKCMFVGECICDKKLWGLVIFVVCFYVFNEIVSLCVVEYGFVKIMYCEVFMLSGSNVFFEDNISDDNIVCLVFGDIVMLVFMVGKGEKGFIEVEKMWFEFY